MFNNREIATAICLMAFAIWALARSDVRKSIARVFRILVNRNVLACLAAMLLYTAAIITVLYAVGFWHLAMIKDAVLWFCCIAFVMVLRFVTSRDDERILRQVFVDNVKLVIVLEFLIGTYVMPLPAELVFVPFVTILVMVDSYARRDATYALLAKCTGFLVAVTGFAILGFAVSRAIGDYRNLGSMDTVRSIVFLPLMSILFVPFVYGLVILVTYESIIARLKLGPEKGSEVVRYAKCRILFHHGLSLRRLRAFVKQRQFELMQIQTKDDVDRMLASESGIAA